MALRIHKSLPYCYFIKHVAASTTKYELFVVVPMETGESLTFNPSGATLNMISNKVSLELTSSPGTGGEYIAKRFSTIILSNDFDVDKAEIWITSKRQGRPDLMLKLDFEDADDIGDLSEIQIEGETVLNCPYIYMHGYQPHVNIHFPAMLVAQKGYDYVPILNDEAPTDPLGTTEHIRTAYFTKNPAANTTFWQKPTHLNDSTHEYSDPNHLGNYTGVVFLSDKPDKKKKGKVKNTKHPVHPGVIIVPKPKPPKATAAPAKKTIRRTRKKP